MKTTHSSAPGQRICQRAEVHQRSRARQDTWIQPKHLLLTLPKGRFGRTVDETSKVIAASLRRAGYYPKDSFSHDSFKLLELMLVPMEAVEDGLLY